MTTRSTVRSASARWAGAAAVLALLGLAHAEAVAVPTSPSRSVQEETDGAGDEAPTWKVEAGVGIVATSGNTETRTLNGSFDLETRRDPWTFAAGLEALDSSESGTTTARRFVSRGAVEYSLTPRDYLFGAVRYTDDRFSGFEFRVSETAGYGRRLIDEESMSLALEIGGGARQSRITGGPRVDDAIVRGAGIFEWDLSANATLRQDLTVEAGGEGTVSTSVTGLTADLAAGFGLRLSFEARHSSEVPAGVEKTDTLTSLNLVYSFGS